MLTGPSPKFNGTRDILAGRSVPDCPCHAQAPVRPFLRCRSPVQTGTAGDAPAPRSIWADGECRTPPNRVLARPADARPPKPAYCQALQQLSRSIIDIMLGSGLDDRYCAVTQGDTRILA